MSTNTTPEFWTFNGVSLNRPCWLLPSNISTLGGARFGLPALRGSNIQVAFQNGQQWRSKVADSRVLTLF